MFWGVTFSIDWMGDVFKFQGKEIDSRIFTILGGGRGANKKKKAYPIAGGTF